MTPESPSGDASPVVTRSCAELERTLRHHAAPDRTVALVPTMGALHAGHAALVRAARDRSDIVVVSIFVNPLQFGPGEDLDRYPRAFEADLDICRANGADVVFAPPVEEVYPGGEPQVTVAPGPLGAVLEGRSRPGHFQGVLTVVAKLFGLVRPDLALFGEKDYQQLVLVRRMVHDLCLRVEVVGLETVRETGGLALSSRNRYLSAEQRTAALALSRALAAGAEAAADGPSHALAAARAVLRGAHGVDLDYLSLTAPDLGPAPAHGAGRLLIAARVGGIRLIDNTAVHLGAAEPEAVQGAGDRTAGGSA
jgi:pantoate--beta-alanine ligase